MSLEAAIIDNTIAVRELIAAMTSRIGADKIATAAPAEVLTEKDTKAEIVKPAAKPKPEAKKPEAEKTVAPTPSADGQTGTADSSDAVTYDQVKAKILELSKDKGREPTIALMARYGVTKGPDLKPTQFAEFIADVDAILAGTYDPEAAELA